MKNIIINNISTSYYVTEDGKCYNSKTNKYLKGQENSKNGYFSYNLTMPNGDKKRCYAHRLVAEAYLSKKNDKQIEVNHIDGNKLNNSIYNLEWVTPEENQQHAIRTELRSYPHIYCFNKDKELVAEYLSIADAAKAIGVSTSNIQMEVNKEVKALTCGFYWSKEKKLGVTKEYQNLGKSKKVYQYDLNGKFINSFGSTGEAARTIGVSAPSHIGECCRGKLKSYKGFIWKYAEDIVSTFDEGQRGTSEVP